jgi:hypothetical protein
VLEYPANRESWLQEEDMNKPITIRYSTESDCDRILELAELDGHRAPAGKVLLAEVDGRLWAAVGVADGAALADPFLPTGEVVELLRLRAEQERELTIGKGPLLGRLMLVRHRAGAIA